MAAARSRRLRHASKPSSSPRVMPSTCGTVRCRSSGVTASPSSPVSSQHPLVALPAGDPALVEIFEEGEHVLAAAAEHVADLPHRDRPLLSAAGPRPCRASPRRPRWRRPRRARRGRPCPRRADSSVARDQVWPRAAGCRATRRGRRDRRRSGPAAAGRRTARAPAGGAATRAPRRRPALGARRAPVRIGRD